MIAVAISGIEVKSTETKVMARSWNLPSRIPARTPVISASGIISAKTQNARMPVLISARPSSIADILVLLEGTAEITVGEPPHPFAVALVDGDVQPLVLKPLLVVGVGQRGDGEAAELVDRELLLEFRAVENDEKNERDDGHDQSHLQKPLQDELQHCRSPPLIPRLPSRGRRRPSRLAKPAPCQASASRASSQDSIQTLLNWWYWVGCGG